VTSINAYDDYGIPQGKSANGAVISGGLATSSFGRFGYTGQVWLPEVGLNYYKNRAYSPTLGRFMQPDPIGYGDGVNLYAYVKGDPINFNDPLGLEGEEREIVVKGKLLKLKEVSPLVSGGAALLGSFFDGTNLFGQGRSPSESMGEEEPEMMCPPVPASRPIGSTGLAGAAVRDPTGAIIAATVRGIANDVSGERFPALSVSGTARDAFRHFFAAFALTKLIGPTRALNILNANEVSGANSAIDRNMDTFNNFVAIQMAQNPQNRGKATADLADAALTNGCLKVTR
jgi:RHS repeat-associated protein